MNAKPVERHGPYLVQERPSLVLDSNGKPKTAVLSVRVRQELKDEMDRVASAGPYRIAVTAMVERGIELAIRELDELAKRLK